MEWTSSTSNAKQPTLASLLEQSRKLLPAQRQDLPFIELGLDQIEQQSRKLAQRQREPSGNAGAQTEEQLAKAHYMLARAQVDTSQLTRTLNQLQPAAAFTPLQPHLDNDLNFLSKQAHESALISCIEEGRRRTVNDFYSNLRQEMIRDWEKKKFQVLEELARHHPALVSSEGAADSASPAGTPTGTRRRSGSSSQRRASGVQFEPYSQSLFNQTPAGSATSELQMHARMMKYDQAVAHINAARRREAPIGAITVLSEAAASVTSQGTSRALPVADTYNLLKSIVGEEEVSPDGEFTRTSVSARQYAAAYSATGADAERTASVQLRQQIVTGSKRFLEDQFVKHVESTLAKHPQAANLGGEPGISNTIRAYVSVLYNQNSTWAPSLEIINGAAVYPRLFFLIRAGRTEEAVKLATSVEFESSLIATEPNFITYLKAWAPSRTRSTSGLSRSVRDRFLTEYNQRIRYLSPVPGSSSSADPFKIALYKLFGRAELNKRNVPGVTDKTEHWLWFQLAMIREESAESLNASQGSRSYDQLEKYSLRDFAAVLRKFGEAHWDPKGQRPGLYLQVLLLSGQFERAIAFLYQRQPHRVDAVHFAISLAYYGLLRVAEQAQTSELELLTTTTDAAGYEVGQINFARLIHRYYRSFAKEDPAHALQYIATISLTLPGASQKLQQEQKSIIADYIKDLLIQSKAYAPLLGELSAEGRTTGAVGQNAKLLGIEDTRLFVQQLVKAIVTSTDGSARFSDSILLYNLAEDYNGVVEVLSAELGASLSQSGVTQPGEEDVLAVAKSVLDHYERSRVALDRKRKDTLVKLIKIKEAFSLYEAGRLDDALVTLESVHVLPLAQDTDIVPVIKTAEDFKELDENITRNFDAIMLTAMNIVYAIHQQLKESPYGDSSRVNRMAEIKKKARSIMMFAGLLRYRLNATTYHELSRREVFIH